ncbi:MAG: adenylate/guanylate cyclase domain-containing protein, partial [Chroococcales cyanobacterium]
FEELSGYTHKELLGKEFVPSATSEQLREVYQIYVAGTQQLYPPQRMPLICALKGKSLTVDDMEIHQGEQIIPLEVWGTPIFDEKGNVAYAIAAFQDISDRKQAEAERMKFTNQLFELNKAYERFVPRQFLQLLEKDSIIDLQLDEAVEKKMSVLFADIRNFTTLSEQMTPNENFKFINSFLKQMEPAIISNNGFIDKYIGDEIMALFQGSADDAVKAAIAMLKQLTIYNQTRLSSQTVPVQIGIGINTGLLMLGTVGGNSRMDSTVISDAVNLASRIERLTKAYQVSLLISHATFLELEDATQYDIRMIDCVTVKGKSIAVTVYEVFDADLPPIREIKLATRVEFERAVLCYHSNCIPQAIKGFEYCLNSNPGDTVAQIYQYRCQQHY